MKTKLLVLLATSLLLTGCSITDQTEAAPPAQAQVILGCNSFNLKYNQSNGFKTPIQAQKHFGEAARLDPGYIPLAEAAQVLTHDPYSNYTDINYRAIRFNASQLVIGVCAK
jgi:PBP1b-binding outer membrane lipoprotein LpoB